MKHAKLGLLGGLIALGAILLIVSTFTPCWVIQSYSDWYDHYNQCTGTVFWGGSNYWVNLASWEMLLCIILYIVMCYAYYKAIRKIRKHGYCRRYKKWFKNIVLLSAVILFFLLFAIISTASSVPYYYGGSLGYSAYIAVGCTVITFVIMLYALHIAVKEQWNATSPFQTVQVVQQPQTMQMVQQPQTVQMVQVPETTVTTTTVQSAPAVAAPQAYQIATSQPASNPAVVRASPVAPQVYQIAQPASQPVATTVLATPQVAPQIYQVAPSAPPPSAPPAQANQPIYVVYPSVN